MSRTCGSGFPTLDPYEHWHGTPPIKCADPECSALYLLREPRKIKELPE